MRGAFSLGKIFGIQFRLHYTWFLIFILITLSLVYPNWSQPLSWGMGILTSLLLFASVLAHELSHSLVGRTQGIPIKSITLFIFGGVAQMTKEASKASAELKMAAAGPACSLLLGAIFGAIWFLTRNTVPLLAEMTGWLAVINVILAAFNLIPGFPLDGGRVFRSLMWHFSHNYRLSTKIAVWLGQGIGYAFIFCGILIVFVHPFGLSWFDGLWIAFIGWFLQNAASSSYRQTVWREALRGFTVSQVMTSDYIVVPPDMRLSELVQKYIMSIGHRFFLIANESKFFGILTLNNIKPVPQTDWDSTLIDKVMVPADKLLVAEPEQEVLSVLEKMDENAINQMPVVSKGKVVGLVTRDNLARFLRTRSDLGI